MGWALDGKEGPEFDGILQYSLQFSPDSMRFAYAGARGKKKVAVIDGKESPEFGDMTQPGPLFSTDSLHVVYAAGTKGQGWLVINGQKTTPYDGFGKFCFDGPNLIRAVAARFDESFNKLLVVLEVRILTD